MDSEYVYQTIVQDIDQLETGVQKFQMEFNPEKWRCYILAGQMQEESIQ